MTKKKLCNLLLSLFLMVFGGFVSYFILKVFSLSVWIFPCSI